MRQLPEGMLEACQGSLSDGGMEFTSWYDGRIVAQDIPQSGWSQSFSGGQQVSGTTNLTVVDESGDLAPWGVDDALGVGGALLQSRLVVGNMSVNLGRQRITASNPTETWRMGPDGLTWVSGGSTIDVTASDLTTVVAGSKFLSLESPLSNNGVIAEIRRLLLGIMDVTFELDEASSDLTIPPSLTYKEERMDAVEDLISALGCNYRVSGTGQLVVYRPDRVSEWTIEAGTLPGSLMVLSRSQSITGLNNIIIAKNTLSGGDEIMAAAMETSGPLRANGPHGRWPVTERMDFASTQVTLQSAADVSLSSYVRSRSVAIPLTTIFHPGLEVGDWITVECPLNSGITLPLEGRVTSIQYTGPGIPGSMDISIQADLVSVQAISDRLRQERWIS